MKTIREEIGARTKALRKSLSMNQAEFGAVAGITRASVANVETGRNLLTLESLLLVCHYAGITPSKFLEGLTLEQFLPPESVKFIEENHPELRSQFLAIIFRGKPK